MIRAIWISTDINVDDDVYICMYRYESYMSHKGGGVTGGCILYRGGGGVLTEEVKCQHAAADVCLE